MFNTATWGYATLFWDYHLTESGLPQQQLLQAFYMFDIFHCFVDTLGSNQMHEECRNTIKRVALPARVTVLEKIAQIF